MNMTRMRIAVLFLPKNKMKRKKCGLSEDRFNLTSFFYQRIFSYVVFSVDSTRRIVFFFFFFNKEFCVLYFSSARCIKHDVEFNVMKQIQRQQLSTFFSFYFIFLDQDLLCWFLTPAIPLTLFVYR